MVSHSYGGMVGAGPVEGLGYAQRSKASQPGGVILVVWLAAFVGTKDKGASLLLICWEGISFRGWFSAYVYSALLVSL